MLEVFRSALWLIRDVSLPSLREHRLRALLTLVGVVIGTQVVVAIGLLNRSVLASFAHTVETIAGRAALQVSNGSAGVPEELAAKLAAAPSVTSATGLLQGTLRTAWGDLTVFGVDLFEDQTIRETQFPRANVHIKDGLGFANSTDSIAVSSSFMTHAALALGDTFIAGGPTGESSLAIRGTLDPAGPAALFGGAVGLVDFPTAQRLFGRPGRFDQIDVMLKRDVSPAEALRELMPLVAGVGVLEPPQQRGAALGSMLSAVQTGLAIVSLIAVMVGVFIIYHTMRTAIAARRRELALVRAVGYQQRVISIAIVLEVLAFGVLGSWCGLLLGIGTARLSLALVTNGIGAIWARVDHPGLVMRPLDVAGAFALGIATTLAAAAIPLVSTARMRIVDDLRAADDLEISSQSSIGRDAFVGFGVALVAYVLFYSPLRPQTFAGQATLIMGSLVLATLAFTLVIPLVTALLAQSFARFTSRYSGLASALAAENVARDPGRTRGTIAALMVAFALVLETDSFIHSLRKSILTWFDETLTSDFLVTPTLQLDLPSGPTMSGTLAQRLRRIPGVAEVSTSRMISIRLGGTLAVLRTESAGGFLRQHYQLVAGDPTTFQERFAKGQAVLVSDNFAYRHQLTAGDSLTLATPSGAVTFPIAAVVLDYTLDIGTVVIERERYRELWRDDLANSFRIWVQSGSDAAQVRENISATARPEFTVVVLTAAQYKRNIAQALDNALLLTYAIQLVAVAIAVIGVVNFFLAEVVDRRREIRLLRSVALTRGQIVSSLAIEAGIVGTIGGVMAVLSAWPVAHAVVTRATRLVSGLGLTFCFRGRFALATVLLAAGVSVLAALYPARRAVATPIVELVHGE